MDIPSEMSDMPSEPGHKGKQKRELDKTKFFCQNGKDLSQPSMNKFIEQELLKMQKIYHNEKDIGRRIAYGKAASIIRTHKEEISSESDVGGLVGIGPKIKLKIKEIIRTGRLSKLEELNQSEEVVAMGQLSRVWGIGPAKAN